MTLNGMLKPFNFSTNPSPPCGNARQKSSKVLAVSKIQGLPGPFPILSFIQQNQRLKWPSQDYQIDLICQQHQSTVKGLPCLALPILDGYI
jgi:hypothetical protein